MMKCFDSQYYTGQNCFANELSSTFKSVFIGNCTDPRLWVHYSVDFDLSFRNDHEDFHTDVQPFAMYGNFCANQVCFAIDCDDIPNRGSVSLVGYYGTPFLVFIASVFDVGLVELLVYS